ncbi:MAG: aldehyde dehydrogenase [Actinomycetia bacterium]|nr:aldehyde dehydrogenase [Actinomycetes bacterium]
MSGRLDRRVVAAAAIVGADDEGLLVVSGLGAPTWDVAAAGDRDLTFPLWGAMGGAVMIGLGLAVARPDHRVLVVTGDGELLMGLGSLSTVGSVAPINLGVLVLDNERYGETGMQATHTSGSTDLAGVATACGFRATQTTDESELEAAIDLVRAGPGPALVVVKVSTDIPTQVVPPRDGTHLVERFRAALA